MSASNIHYEMAERSRAVNYGGIGAMHLMGQKLGLAEEIDARVQLLKRHLPYQESDHVAASDTKALVSETWSMRGQDTRVTMSRRPTEFLLRIALSDEAGNRIQLDFRNRGL